MKKSLHQDPARQEEQGGMELGTGGDRVHLQATLTKPQSHILYKKMNLSDCQSVFTASKVLVIQQPPPCINKLLINYENLALII